MLWHAPAGLYSTICLLFWKKYSKDFFLGVSLEASSMLPSLRNGIFKIKRRVEMNKRGYGSPIGDPRKIHRLSLIANMLLGPKSELSFWRHSYLAFLNSHLVPTQLV